MEKEKKWFAIVNPNSANGKTHAKWPLFYQRIIDHGIEVDYSYTSAHGNGIEVTKQAISQGYKKFIAVGGDGSINEVVNGFFDRDRLIREDLELAILANGTGSDYIRTIKSYNDINSFVHTLKERNIKKVDVVKVTYQNHNDSKENRYYLNAANLGIGAEVVNRTNSRNKVLGSILTYFVETVITALKFKSIFVSLVLDDNKTIEGKFCGLVICNGQYIGGGMHIAPQAIINDGLLDLVLIKDISKYKLFSSIPLIYKGNHINLPEVEIYRCKKISLVTSVSTLVETDGEIIGFSPSKVDILPQCLKLRI